MKKQHIVLDALKRPAAVGDTVLATGYGSPIMSTIATIVQIRKNVVMIELPIRRGRRVEDAAAQWGYRYEYYTENKRMRRQSYQFLVINEQLAYNSATFPEYYI
jgi:hypothetical protein